MYRWTKLSDKSICDDSSDIIRLNYIIDLQGLYSSWQFCKLTVILKAKKKTTFVEIHAGTNQNQTIQI